MSVIAPPAPASSAGVDTDRGVRARVVASADVRAVIGLGLLFAALTAVTWGRWGVPLIDAGVDLTAAQRVADGAVLYRDIRYFYGPVGIYALAGAFNVFGASFTTAFAFGLAQFGAIIAAFYALARCRLPALTSFLATAIVIAIGFSGTAFNFVLPHTNSATFGILFLLLMLLALARDRLVLAGLAAGVVGLTRPEFALVAALGGAAFLIGLARQNTVAAAVRAAPRLALPALVLAGGVLAVFASSAGASVLFTEDLWPVDFLRVTHFGSQQTWAPLDAASAVATVARAAVYGSLLAGVVASAVGYGRRRGAARLLALWPLVAAVVGLLAAGGLWRISGAFPAARSAVEQECTHLLIGMSWLPALAFGVAAYTLVRLVRGDRPPFSRSWADDLALVAVAAALGARAYDAFTAEASYAPYYAAPLVLVLACVHERIVARWPSARTAALAALAAVAAGLAAYALVALYPDQGTEVRTARGSFRTTAASARALQPTIDFVRRHSDDGQPILALPADAGLYFMTDRPPALTDLMFLPGLLDSAADERAAIARMRAERVPLAVVGARRFVGYGYAEFGGDYNTVLWSHLTSGGLPIASFGGPGPPVGGTNPTRAYRVYAAGP